MSGCNRAPAQAQQWQQHQQSAPSEGSKNTTILNGPGNHTKTGAQDPPIGSAPQGVDPPAPQP